MVDGDVPPKVKKDAHALILEFIRSRPPLKKVRFDPSYMYNYNSQLRICACRLTDTTTQVHRHCNAYIACTIKNPIKITLHKFCVIKKTVFFFFENYWIWYSTYCVLVRYLWLKCVSFVFTGFWKKITSAQMESDAKRAVTWLNSTWPSIETHTTSTNRWEE